MITENKLYNKILSTTEKYSTEGKPNKLEIDLSDVTLDKYFDELTIKKLESKGYEFIINNPLRHYVIVKIYSPSKPLEYTGLLINTLELDDE